MNERENTTDFMKGAQQKYNNNVIEWSNEYTHTSNILTHPKASIFRNTNFICLQVASSHTAISLNSQQS